VTLALLERKLRGEPDAPHLIIHPRIQVTLLGRTCEIEPDALVASDSDTFYRVVEIKSYVDRRGKTSSTALRGACRQAAVGVVGLRQESSALSCAEQMVGRIKAQADLILRRPGSMLPTLHPMSLQGEVESLELALGRAGRELGVIESLLEAGESLSTPEALNKLPKHYTEGCREFCALAPVCKRQAVECSEPALLGNGVREALRSVGSLARALDLLHGRAQPASAQEDVLCVRLQQALVEHRRALSDAG
jgi:hypothetical protein